MKYAPLRQARQLVDRARITRAVCRLRGAIAASMASLAVLLAASGGQAHPISLSASLVDVSEERINVSLEILVEDLVLYYAMDHDQDFYFTRQDLKEQGREHRAFLNEHLQLRDGEGNRLEGRIVDIDFSEIGEDGVHMSDLMAYGITYEFEFPVEQRLKHLSVFQNFDGDNPRIPAEMQVWIFRDGARVDGPTVVRHGMAHTTELDWDAEVDEEDRMDLDEAREHLEEQVDEQLGLQTYGAVYSYIYITETQVRHELLIPLLTLDRWIPIEREEQARITVEEQEAIHDDLFEFLKQHNNASINGVDVEPRLERVEFFGPGVRDFAEDTPQRTQSVYNTRVGVILSFPAETAPESLTFEWHYFDEHMPYFRPTAYSHDGRTHDVLFDLFLTEWEWEAEEPASLPALHALEQPEPAPHLRLPLLSLIAGAAAVLALGPAVWGGTRGRRLTACALVLGLAVTALAGQSVAVMTVAHPLKSAAPDEQRSLQTFQALHENIYRAFEHRDEERIYDALEESVAGPLLEQLYLQVRQGLTMQEQGGAVSRIEEVEILEAKRRPAEGSAPQYHAFQYHCVWTVTGTVEHWGHIHRRTNQYEAAFIVEGLPEGWRITDYQPLAEQRVQVQTRLRND